MTVNNKRDVIDLLESYRDSFQKFGVKRLGVFGSFVRNVASNESDIDLLVEFKTSHKTFDNFMNLSFFLEDLLGRKVDLVTADSLSLHISKNVLQEVEYV